MLTVGFLGNKYWTGWTDDGWEEGGWVDVIWEGG